MLLLGAAPAAAAGEDFAPHVQKAQGCYDAKDFDCAVRELQAAYQIKPVPGLLLNIGHAHLDAGRPQEALTFYGLYLQSEKRLTPGIRADVEKFREQARQKLREAASQPAPAPAPAPTAPSQTEAPPPAAPPAETSPPVAAAPAPAPAPAAPAPPAPRAAAAGVPAGGLALIGVGAGLLIIGLGLGGGAVAAAGQVTAGPGPFDAELDSRGRSFSSAGVALDVIGGLALVGGIGWTAAWAARRNKDRGAAALRPAPTPALVFGRF